MHSAIVEQFPKLGMLWHSSDTTDPGNYFGTYNLPKLLSGTEKQFIEWESLLQSLDKESFEIFLAKARGAATARATPNRGWTQLVECINEVRGYQYALSLGYTNVHLIREQADSLPDIEASSEQAKCLIEVKTIEKSDIDIERFGQVQRGESELPLRLMRVLKKRYAKAVYQLESHPCANCAKKICYMIINLDLRTAIAPKNQKLLQQFIKDLESSVEIHGTSQHWSARLNSA